MVETIPELLNHIEELVLYINDEVIDDFETEQEDGGLVKGIRCRHGGNTYIVYGGEGGNYVTVEFQYRVLNDFLAAELEDNLDAEEAEVAISPEEEPDVFRVAVQNMEDLFENIDDSTATRFQIDVLRHLQNNKLAFEIIEDEEGMVEGFKLYSKIFLSEGEITAKRFYDCVQSALSIGVPTRAYIQYSYGTRDYESPSVLKESIGEADR